MCHEARCASHARKNRPRLFLSEHNGHFLWPLRSDDVINPRQPLFQHLLVEEQQRRERLILCRRRNVHLSCQMAQESLHFFCTHFLWVADAMKSDVAFNPVEVCCLGMGTVAVEPQSLSHSVEQFGLSRVRRNRRFHAAFVTALPSKSQEIDCMNRLREPLFSRIQPIYAAFAGPPPSLSPEICCKLQYNLVRCYDHIQADFRRTCN